MSGCSAVTSALQSDSHSAFRNLKEGAQRCYVSSMPGNPMLRGIVKFRARIIDADKEVTFPVVEFNPNEAGVGKVEIEGPRGSEILSTVHLTAVDNSDQGIAVATKVHVAALDRISFFNDVAIENGDVTESDFSPIIDSQPPGQYHLAAGTGYFPYRGQPMKFSRGLSSSRLKTELEQTAPPGERNFGLFRSARQSTSPVEEFMHLYNLMLMFFDDSRPGAQARLDEFIRREEPGVTSTPDPRRPRVHETVYTRLRNEFAHKRPGVNLDDTKAAMKRNLGSLIALTKRAIESHS
jgi:hypothetical protein